MTLFVAGGLSLLLPSCTNELPVQRTEVINGRQIGGPIKGLTRAQMAKYEAAEAIFRKEFTPEEGLGPIFNGESCFRCHGQPGAIGGEGRDRSRTSIITFARRVPTSEKAKLPLKDVICDLTKEDVDFFLNRGGPSLQRFSITGEFPDKYPVEASIDFEQLPIDAELQSNRKSPIVFGIGLIDNMADGDIISNALKESVDNPDLAGRPISAVDRFTERARAARFGWKCQMVNIMNFAAAAMNIELGITTHLHHTENTPSYLGIMSPKLQELLPPIPNDNGKVFLNLVYFLSLLGPVPRGEITEEVKHGEEVFNQIRCAACHKADAKTVAKAMVPDPDSPLPNIKYIEIEALSGKVFHPYSDFLVHQMGPELADGLPQEGSKGGEFRTTPLWGTGIKRFFLHDSRANSIHEAILYHGGQASSVRDAYKQLPEKDKKALLAFLKSL